MGKPSIIHSVDINSLYMTLLVYSDPGVGKTFLAGTSAREDHDTLIIRPPTDSTDTLKIHFPDVKIDEAVITHWDDLDELHEYLRHEDHGYSWVWLDNLSLMQETCLDGVMEDIVAAKPHRDIWLPAQGNYLQNMNRLCRNCRLLSALDFNLGLTAHVFRYTFETTGRDLMMPWIQGKQRPETVCGYADIVGWLHTKTVDTDDGGEKKIRILETETHNEYYGKDGYGAFPKGRVVEPTIPKIERAVKKKKEVEESKVEDEEDFVF